jgi:hypothetical protein
MVATKSSVGAAMILAASLLIGTVAGSSAAAAGSTRMSAKAKRCATTGTYVKPGKTKPVGNSGKNSETPGGRGRHGRDDDEATCWPLLLELAVHGLGNVVRVTTMEV